MPHKPHFKEHRKRLRKRFREAGVKGLHDYELLELLLTYAIPRRDVKPIAKRLITRFGGISGVLDASQVDLEGVDGVGPVSSALFPLVKELLSVYLGERIKKEDVLSSPRMVVDFSRVKLSGLSNEVFMTIYLNVKNEVLDYEILHEGTVDNVAIYPRRIIETALSRHASGIILVHNHPSGNPDPSEEDKQLTREIAKAAGTLDIRVLDHIVVGKCSYFSFMENGILEKDL